MSYASLMTGSTGPAAPTRKRGPLRRRPEPPPARCRCRCMVVDTLAETLDCPRGWREVPGIGWVHALGGPE